jgi:uridine phosphorylase
MAKKDQRVCSVTGIKTSEDNFYRNQNHIKAVDNIRRNTEVTKEQLTRMFNQINNY